MSDKRIDKAARKQVLSSRREVRLTGSRESDKQYTAIRKGR